MPTECRGFNWSICAGVAGQVLEVMGRSISRVRGQVVQSIEQSHQRCRAEYTRWNALPDGTNPDQAFEALLHCGIVQPQDRFALSEPSLADYMATQTAPLHSALHNTVLEVQSAVISLLMEACPDEAEQGRLLHATDQRRRTPLILAVELRIGSVVEQLVAVEGQLPARLCSVGMRDHAGRTARDHAAASGDECLVALLSQFSANKQISTKVRGNWSAGFVGDYRRGYFCFSSL